MVCGFCMSILCFNWNFKNLSRKYLGEIKYSTTKVLAYCKYSTTPGNMILEQFLDFFCNNTGYNDDDYKSWDIYKRQPNLSFSTEFFQFLQNNEELLIIMKQSWQGATRNVCGKK